MAVWALQPTRRVVGDNPEGRRSRKTAQLLRALRRGGGIAHGLPDRPAAIGLSLSFRIMVATQRNVRMGDHCHCEGMPPLRKSRVVFLNAMLSSFLAKKLDTSVAGIVGKNREASRQNAEQSARAIGHKKKYPTRTGKFRVVGHGVMSTSVSNWQQPRRSQGCPWQIPVQSCRSCKAGHEVEEASHVCGLRPNLQHILGVS